MILIDFVAFAGNINFLITSITSTILIYLLIVRSKKHFGSYKYLMIVYALIEFIFSIVVVISGILAHSMPDCFILFVRYNGRYRNLAQLYVLQGVLLYAFMIGTLTVHFLYRYFAICRRPQLRYFEGVNLMFWLSFMLAGAILVAGLKFFFMGEYPEKTEKLRPEILSNYNLTMEQIGYNGPLYFLEKYQYSSFATMFFILAFLSISASIMVYCGIQCHRKLQSADFQFSKNTLNIQKQMYIALITQAVLPTLFMYIPVESLFFLPMFKLSIGKHANIAIALATIFTSVDQIAIIFVIKDFRVFFLERWRTLRRSRQITHLEEEKDDFSFQNRI